MKELPDIRRGDAITAEDENEKRRRLRHLEMISGGYGINVQHGHGGVGISLGVGMPMLAKVKAYTGADALYDMYEIDRDGAVFVGAPEFQAYEANGNVNVAVDTRVQVFEGGRPGHWVFFRPRIVTFDASCKIDNTPANRGTSYPGNTQVTNQRTVAASGGGSGGPDANTEEWLLCHLSEPVMITDGVWLHLLFHQFVTWAGAFVPTKAYFEWDHWIITDDFDCAGPGCATWNTQPPSVYGCGGVVHIYANGDSGLGTMSHGGWSVEYESNQQPSTGVWDNHAIAYGIMFKITSGVAWRFIMGGLTNSSTVTSLDPIHAHSFMVL